MFEGLANMASLLRQAQQMGGRMQEVSASLKAKRALGTAGAGLVRVEVDGLGEVLGVQIEPDLVARNEREMIEDLVRAAVNDASVKSRQLHLEAMNGLTQGLKLPGLEQALAQLSGNPP